MAKAVSKTSTKSPRKKTVESKTVSPVELIVTACEISLAKLNDLDIEHALQSEINWCLASFHNDKNPIGLYQMAERSIVVFKGELSKKTKGVTAKLIKDIEQAIKAA